MSYAPTTDFIALLRKTDNGAVRFERVPGLDYVLAAMARMNLFQVWTGQTAPTVNQSSTVWLKVSFPNAWAAEGAVFLFDATTGLYELATPALWSAFLAGPLSGYSFQAVTVAAAAVADATSLLAIERATPAATALTLPRVVNRNGKPLQIVDWSTAVALHTVTLAAQAGETIMRLATWQLVSTPDQLTGMTLYPSLDLAGWVIAP